MIVSSGVRRSAGLASLLVILGLLSFPRGSCFGALGSVHNDEEEPPGTSEPLDIFASTRHSKDWTGDPTPLSHNKNPNLIPHFLDFDVLPQAEADHTSQSSAPLPSRSDSVENQASENVVDQRILQDTNELATWTPISSPLAQPAQGQKPTDDRFHPLFSPSGWDIFQNFDSESIIVHQSPATASPVTQSPMMKWPSKAPINHTVSNSSDAFIKESTACNSAFLADQNSPCSNTTIPPVATIVPATPAPSSSNSTTPSESRKFQKFFINAGGDTVLDIFANDWLPDTFFVGGVALNDTEATIDGTRNDQIYQSQRVGTFDYEIPLPEGNYELILHFVELNENVTEGIHVFDVSVEKQSIFPMVDIVALIGSPRKALTLETAIVVVDGHLSLSFRSVSGLPTLSAIEIDLVGPHLAHAVAGGPYEVVDIDSDGIGSVQVDGSLSHTHGVGLDLISWQWYERGALVGIGETATLTLPVGEHDIVLKVLDNGGNQHSEAITVTVRPSGHPVISSLSPNSGDLSGRTPSIINGFGFHFPIDETTIRFGQHNMSSSDIRILNATQIEILNVPSSEFGIPVPISVVTPAGESNVVLYTYVDRVPIEWRGRLLLEISKPTTLAFGPDQKLYIGTSEGKLLKVTLTNDFDNVLSIVESSMVNGNVTCLPSNCRSILGIAFDPLDLSPNPSVYVSHSKIFHGSRYSSSGDAVNGKVSRLSGPDLEFIEDIITGLPVSDHDHGVNGLEFGDNGELYVLVGGNTNAGIPGSISGSKLQKEGLFSAAALVAYIGRIDFDGHLRYDQLDDGNLIRGSGVEVFSSGLRNPYDLVLHSMNGQIYATDNGPNSGYGKTSVSCAEGVDDVEEEDKLNLLIKGQYYGHANRKRGETDAEQCVWKSAHEPTSTSYVAPLAILPASSDGIIEFQSNHFHGQLRGNLIIAKYKGGLYRAILTKDGRAVVHEANPPFLMTSDGGLDITQGPSGQLYTAKYKGGKIRFLKAQEPSTETLALKSVFPRRGHVDGGTTLHIFGENLDKQGIPSILVGNKSCKLASLGAARATCIIPGGFGRQNVAISAGNQTSVLIDGYRYITGVDVSSDSPSTTPSNEPLTEQPSEIMGTTSTPTSMPSKSMPSSPPFTPFSFRLNAGGGYFRDQIGRLWEPDAFHNFFIGPSTITLTERSIAHTEDDPLFQSARYFQRNRPGPYVYEIPVPVQGFYRVNLGFAEIVDWRSEVGDRKVNVTIENVRALTDMDIVHEANGGFAAIITTHRSLVLDGHLTIEFTPVKFNPMINTIEILLEDVDLAGVDLSTVAPSSSPSESPMKFETLSPSLSTKPSTTPLPVVVRINAGGKAMVDSKGDSWEADDFYHGVSSTVKTKASIGNTDDDSLFRCARFFRRNRRGPFFYDIPVPAVDNYTVTLGFAEIVDWRSKIGDRRMIISIEDELLLDKFDIVEAAGAGFTATFETFNVQVMDGNLTIVFTPFKFNPTVNTIEVFVAKD